MLSRLRANALTGAPVSSGAFLALVCHHLRPVTCALLKDVLWRVIDPDSAETRSDVVDRRICCYVGGGTGRRRHTCRQREKTHNEEQQRGFFHRLLLMPRISIPDT